MEDQNPVKRKRGRPPSLHKKQILPKPKKAVAPFYQLFGNHRPPLHLITDLLDRVCNNERGTMTNDELSEHNIDPTKQVWFISHFAHTRYLLYCKRKEVSMFWLVNEVLPYIRSARKHSWRNKINSKNAIFNYNQFVMLILQVTSAHQLVHLKTISYVQQDEIVNVYIGYPKKTEEDRQSTNSSSSSPEKASSSSSV